MRISDWSSDVCSSDLGPRSGPARTRRAFGLAQVIRCPLIDFHCHLDLYPDPPAVARACRERGPYVLPVTTTPSAWAGTSALADGAARMRTALGLHPQIAQERKPEQLTLERLLAEKRYAGEKGLAGGTDLWSLCADNTAVDQTLEPI